MNGVFQRSTPVVQSIVVFNQNVIKNYTNVLSSQNTWELDPISHHLQPNEFDTNEFTLSLVSY